MSLSQTIKLFFNYIIEAFDELYDNLGIYLVYIFILSLATIIPNWMNVHFNNISVPLQLLAKIVFSIVPLLILSKIIYVFKIRSLGLGEYTKTFFSYLVYSLLLLLLLGAAGIIISFPLYLYSLRNSAWLLAIAPVGILMLLYFVIFYSLTPVVAAIESDDEEREGSFSKSKVLTKRNVSLVLINLFCQLFIYVVTSSLLFVKDPNTRLLFSAVFALFDSLFTIVLTLTSVKIYFYLNSLE
jgi:hypothetical protein